ncbi:hypothetical protein MJH12_11945, partial [bacterium]|nr:hypothetical protein [bacterium]
MSGLFNQTIKLMTLLLIIVNGISAASATRNLVKGWNLVSIPTTAEKSVDTVLTSDFRANLAKIWIYDGTWAKYVPNETNTGTGRFDTFKKNRGYWFKMTAADDLVLNVDGVTASPLELDRTGWALVSFNQTSDLDIATKVLSTDTIDANHEATNIAKVWEYGATWSKYVPGAGSNVLATIKPQYAYWFKVQNTTKTVSTNDKMTITPVGSAGAAQLVIGGATSLTPPTAQQAPLRFRASNSRFGARSARVTEAVVGGVVVVQGVNVPASFTCESSADHGKAIGLAEAFSIDGDKLNLTHPAPILCDYSVGQTFKPTYEISFSSDESTHLLTHPEITSSLVVKVALFSGQTQKSILPDFGDEVSSFSAGAQVKQTHELSSASTLGAEEVASQIAKKLGIPADKFMIAELN